MARTNGHAPTMRKPGGLDPLKKIGQVIEADDYQRLCRISDAIDLLGRLPSEAAQMLGIKADHTSAVAHYIAEDLAAIIARSRPADE